MQIIIIPISQGTRSTGEHPDSTIKKPEEIKSSEKKAKRTSLGIQFRSNRRIAPGDRCTHHHCIRVTGTLRVLTSGRGPPTGAIVNATLQIPNLRIVACRAYRDIRSGDADVNRNSMTKIYDYIHRKCSRILIMPSHQLGHHLPIDLLLKPESCLGYFMVFWYLLQALHWLVKDAPGFAIADFVSRNCTPRPSETCHAI